MAETTSLHLRLPKKLYKRLQQQARHNNASLNTEIVNQLEGRTIAVSPERMLEVINRNMAAHLRDTIKKMIETGEMQVKFEGAVIRVTGAEQK